MSAIRRLPGVRILEGDGLRAVTVEMPESVARAARSELDFATVSDYRDLSLL